ncbi:MAG: hypothetical protein P8M07_02665 [Flavobacteriales bacterium]|nr:hypothetical protein [Flavobacteriales bacterium]
MKEISKRAPVWTLVAVSMCLLSACAEPVSDAPTDGLNASDGLRIKFGPSTYAGLAESDMLQAPGDELPWRSADTVYVKFLFDEKDHGDYDAEVQDANGQHLKTIYRGAFKRGVNELKFKYRHLEPGDYRWLMTDYLTGDTLQWSAWSLMGE